MLQQEIDAIRDNVISILKKNKENTYNKKDWQGYYPAYPIIVELAEDIRAHISKTFPEKIFKEKAPNEDPAQFNYRKNNYRATTNRIWNRMQTEANRIWNSANYEIAWPEESKTIETVNGYEDSQMGYFTKEYPTHKSIISYFESIVTKLKVNDPNAVLVVNPGFPVKQNEEGETVISDNELNAPYCQIYSCERVVAYKEGEYCMILLPEMSYVGDGTRKVKEGLIFELYTIDTIYRFEQYGKKADYTFNQYTIYEHFEYEGLLAWKLEGVPVEDNDLKYYKSIFADAIPLLNSACYDTSTLDISKVGAAFPHRWAFVDHCNVPGCNDGQVISEKTGELVACGVCHGTGKKSMFTPMGVHEITPPTSLQDAIPTPPFGFVEPQLGTLEFLRKEIDNNMNAALEVAGINVSNSKVAGNETATGRLIDREALFATMISFAKETFDLLGEVINAIGWIRYSASFYAPAISAPVTIAMRTENDLTSELKTAKEAGMPEMVTRRLMKEFLFTRFSNSTEMERIMDIIAVVDSLFVTDNVDILAGVGVGVIQKWEAVLHRNIFGYIESEMEADKDFLTKDISEIKTILVALAKADVPTNDFSAAEILRRSAEPAIV